MIFIRSILGDIEIILYILFYSFDFYEFVWEFVYGIAEELQLCRWKEDILKSRLMNFDEIVVNPIHRHSVAKNLR